ncbi:HAD-IB family phosphatase [Candidatus Woesearchaeota archaeon]|nr:HAD-IB family phosphatase [Candidatus Woesearchaeota archaeon]
MKIAFLDLEGTLVKCESWNKVKTKFGAKELSDAYDKLYAEGKVGFEEWRRELVKVWKKNKVTKQQFIDILKDYNLVEGAKELISGLKNKGFKTIVITGEPDIFTELFAEKLGVDEFYCAHEFIFDSNGFFKDIKTHESYRRGEGKVHFIKEIIKKEGIDIKECIAVGGDDINDYWMMKELESFAVNPQLRQIKEVVDHNVDKLVDILGFI